MTHLKSVINDYLEGSADQVPQLRHLQGHLLAGFANFAEDSLHVGPHFCKLNLDLPNWIEFCPPTPAELSLVPVRLTRLKSLRL